MSSFTIATINIRHGQGPFLRRGERDFHVVFPRKFAYSNGDALGEYIASMHPRPDILCLQEANAGGLYLPRLVHRIQERAGYTYAAVPLDLFLSHNNAILSDQPLTDIVSVEFRKLHMIRRYGLTSLWNSPNRGFIMANWNDKGFVVNTHINPFGGRVNAAVRKLQLRPLLELLEHRPVLSLVGDFNTHRPDEPVIKMLQKSGYAASPHATKQHYRAHATWPVGKASVVQPRHRFDYIFAGPDSKIVTSRLFDTHLSDHFGVVAKISY